jgi:hypothetical protein
MLTRNVRYGCRWYDSRGWTFPPIAYKFCCRATNSREDDKVASDMEVCTKQRCVNECLHAERNCSSWHSSTLAERLLRPNSGCENSEAVRSGWLCTAVIFLGFRCSATLIKLRAWICRVRPEKKTTFLLQHDNARHHTSLKTMEHVAKFGWTVFQRRYFPLFISCSFCANKWRYYFWSALRIIIIIIIITTASVV